MANGHTLGALMKMTPGMVTVFYLLGQRRRSERVLELARAVNMGSKASEKEWAKYVKELME